eukprot:c18494_g1_i2 orf=331-636(-)
MVLLVQASTVHDSQRERQQHCRRPFKKTATFYKSLDTKTLYCTFKPGVALGNCQAEARIPCRDSPFDGMKPSMRTNDFDPRAGKLIVLFAEEMPPNKEGDF